MIEGAALAARRLEGQPLPGFAAFLDGVQASRVLAHGEDGAPVLHGTVAAVVRVRVDRRLVTWVGAPLSRARSTCQMATSSRRDLMGFVRTEST